MPQSKQHILDNVELYTAGELVEFINGGIVTFEELKNDTDGYLSAKVRKEIERRLNGDAPKPEPKPEPKAPSKPEPKAEAPKPKVIPPVPDEQKAIPVVPPAVKPVKPAETPAIPSTPDPVTAPVPAATPVSEPVFIPEPVYIPEPITEPKEVPVEEQKTVIISKAAKPTPLPDSEAATVPMFNVAHKPAPSLPESKPFEELAGALAANSNLLRSATVRALIDEGHISGAELADAGINPQFVKRLQLPFTPFNIASACKRGSMKSHSTEVYFWGVPSSGKSSAISGVISSASRQGRQVAFDSMCQGFPYMKRLAEMYNHETGVTILPPATPLQSSFEIALEIEDSNGIVHPVSIIDLPGQLLGAIHKSGSNEQLDYDERVALDNLTGLLTAQGTQNTKIHFFVLEYSENDVFYNGFEQHVYLSDTLRYLQLTGSLASGTAALFLLVTKVDRTGHQGPELQLRIRDFLMADKNRELYRALQQASRDCGINNGVVEILPFSIGEVCFRDLCIINETPSANIIAKILQKSPGFHPGA